VAKAASYRYIGGTVTDAVSGEPIAGITVSAGPATAVTDADGRYLLQFDATGDPGVGFEVSFYDYQHRYFYGFYDTLSKPGNLGISGDVDLVVPGDADAPSVDVGMTLGKHISGTVTGQGTPPKPLANVMVVAIFQQFGQQLMWGDTAVTAADGSYSITVIGDPPGPDGYQIPYTVAFLPASLYQMGCWDHGLTTVAAAADVMDCSSPVVVTNADVTGIDAQLPLLEGDSLVLGSAGGTGSAGSSQSFTATLAGVANQVRPAEWHMPEKQPVMNPDVSDGAVFSISGGGTCTHNACTPPTEGDYTITATYGSATGQTTFHAGPPAPSPSASPLPSALPSAAVTPPPTSTSRPDSGQGSLLPATMLLGLAAATLIVARVRRRSLLLP
jgi:hypothetical protein